MNINIIGPVNQLGYGITCLNIIKALSKDHKVSLFPIGQPQVTSREDAEIISQAIKDSKFVDFKAPCIRIWHQHDMSQFVGTGLKVGFPIFELDTFSDLEKHHLSNLDKIFVCSHWAKQVVLSNIKIDETNVCVIPLGVDEKIFKPLQEPDDILIDKPTIFFNCGKWEIRKGHDILVQIFNEAFDEEDNVQLWLMCENPFLSEEETKHWHSMYFKSKLGQKIRIIPRLDTQADVYNIMKQIDCGIFPSKAEGWNLELLELMSCGKPVITTNYSAHTEFCNQDNSYLVDIQELELAQDNKWFFGQGKWAKISQKEIDKFVDYMQYVHMLKSSNNLILNQSGISTADKFSWKQTAEAIINNV
jgi:glycosyltransferase involved in cell wall biosynthesis